MDSGERSPVDQADGSTVTRKDLVAKVAERIKAPPLPVRRVFEELLKQIEIELMAGRRIELRRFGVFEVRQRKSRLARNPQTLDPVNLPDRKVVKFRPGSDLLQSLNHTPGALPQETESKEKVRAPQRVPAPTSPQATPKPPSYPPTPPGSPF